MKVLVDTCVWSGVLRHKNPDRDLSRKLTDLIKDARVVMIGSIRQELLSNLSDANQFKKLSETLSRFEDIALKTEYFIQAAEFSNLCRPRQNRLGNIPM